MCIVGLCVNVCLIVINFKANKNFFLCKMNNKSELKQKLLHAVGIKF